MSRSDHSDEPEGRVPTLVQAARSTLRSPSRRAALEVVYTNLHRNRLAAAAATDLWQAQREYARGLRLATLGRLDSLLGELADNIERNGGRVLFASDAAEARGMVRDLAITRGVRRVVKTKSMVTEEINLNPFLESAGIRVIETDLGEHILQLDDDRPYHIIAPALHRTRHEIADIFESHAGDDHGATPTDGASSASVSMEDRLAERAEPERLARDARERLRREFQRADMVITGVNFAVAETGTLTLVTNEGNGRLSTGAPRLRVAIMGMERIVPKLTDLAPLLRLLVRSASGQRLSSYVTLTHGARRTDELDGSDELVVVILDNGRSRMLADPALREALCCIRCGACLNACPVYRKVGGHSYGWVYPGPIGAVITPGLSGRKQGRDLPFASTLCGACREACPVQIDLPQLLLELRAQTTEDQQDAPFSPLPWAKGLFFKAFAFVTGGRRRFRWAGTLLRWMLLPWSRRGYLDRSRQPGLSPWTEQRDLPLPRAGRQRATAQLRDRDPGAERSES